MMTKTFKQKVIYGLAIGCITLALGGIAFANEEQAQPKGEQCGMHGMHKPGWHDLSQQRSDNLKKLVEQNIINQEQADQVLAFFKEKGEQRKAEFEKIKDMTPEECQAYMDQHKDQRPDIIADLKASVNLSEDQAKAVVEAVRPHHRHGHHNFSQQISDNLKNLVEQNTINQAQADQVLAFFKEKSEQHKAEFEKMKSMTPEERKAFMDQHRDQRPDIVADLQAGANLTEEQAKAVVEAIRPLHGHHGHGPRAQGAPDCNCNMPPR